MSDPAELRHKAVRQDKAVKTAREREERLDSRLKALLSVDPKAGQEEAGEFVDFPAIQELMDYFYKVTNIGVAIIDLKGNMLVATGWQDICLRFHRAHPEALKNCIESDLFLSENVEKGKYILYKCKNNMWDMATPIMAGDEHIANLFLGQFFFEDEAPDREIFIKQAETYGFDEREYLAALDRVPRWNRETVQSVMEFYTRFAGMVSELSYGNIRLARLLSGQKRAEEELRESEERHRLTLEAINDGLWDWNITTGNAVFSPRSYTMLGYEPYEFPPNYDFWKSLIHPEDADRAEREINAHIASGEGYAIEIRMRTKSGGWCWILNRGRVVERDADDHPVRLVGTHSDITERKRSEEEKERLQAQLQQAQKIEAIGTLAGGIAHDFNNILATILACSQIALRDLPDSNPAHVDLQQIVQSTLRATDLVKQILAFSRKTGKEKIHPLRVGSIIKEAIQLLRACLPSTIEIRQSIWSKEDLALIDPTQIHQVLVNLCTNAAHAMREKGGVLGISLTKVNLDACDVIACPGLKPGQYLELSVSDTGHGMDPDTLRQIFDPFFTTKEPGEGTGLGMAVVHRIVRRHGGAIRVHSEPGKGATFDVLLPVIESGPEISIPKDMDMPRGTERILLVDDEEALLAAGKRALEELGYSVIAKKNGQEALAVFQAQPFHFDLVITDCTMPTMAGLDMAREIMRIRPDIPIVLNTGGAVADVIGLAKKIGIREIVTKPLDLCEFVRVVRRALD
ncbi:MAG: PocR ligand-binding domain-containing protein [Syntrophobacteraceae bacterium]